MAPEGVRPDPAGDKILDHPRMEAPLSPAVIVTDTNGIVIYLNDSCEVMFNQSRESLMGQVLGLPIDLGEYSEVDIFRQGQEHSTALMNATLVQWEGQEARLCFFYDITEQKRTQAELKSSEMKFRAFFENLEEGVALHELVRDESGKVLDYRILEVNPAFEAHTGFHATTTRGRLGTEVYGSIPPPYLEEYSKVALGAPPYVFETYFPPLGKHFRISVISPKPDQFATVFQDITERKWAETELINATEQAEEGERTLKAITDQATDGIALADLEGHYHFVNPAFCRMTGYSKEELLGMTVFDVRTKTQSGKSYYTNSTEMDGKVVPIVIQRKNGTQIFTEIIATQVVINDQKLVLGTARDVTEQTLASQANADLMKKLQQSQKMESLGTLAGGVAHDMNNVLGAILGLASAHIGTQPPGSPLHQALDTICKAAERGGKMVKSLLSFARQSPAENNKLDLNAILREQITLLERTTLAKVQLQVDLEADLRPMIGDASALTHAFMNLCVNAVDAMPENGTLTLHTRNVDNDWTEVVVEDNGMGMPKEVLEKAMDPFFTTKETGQGTGLGLSIVFSTVKAHRGQMAIESEPGHGTRVMLRFPACEQEAPAQAAAAEVTEATQAPHGIMKVLLIDDDDLIQSSVRAILEVLGQKAVNTAQSGEEALAMLEAGLEADLVILDMNMPGLGGIGTLPRLRVLRPEVPVLLATGRVDQTALALASAHPGVTLLSKPFGLRELQKHLENIGLG